MSSPPTLEVYSVLPLEAEVLDELNELVESMGGRAPTPFASKTSPGAVVILPADKRGEFLKHPLMEKRTVRHHRTYEPNQNTTRIVPPVEQILREAPSAERDATNQEDAGEPRQSLSFKDALLKPAPETAAGNGSPSGELVSSSSAEEAVETAVADMAPNSQEVTKEEADVLKRIEAAADVPAETPQNPGPSGDAASPSVVVEEVERRSSVTRREVADKLDEGQLPVQYLDPVMNVRFWILVFLVVVLTHFLSHLWFRTRTGGHEIS